MPEHFSIKIEGMDRLRAALRRFPVEVKANMQAAAKESADKLLLPTQGLQKYPPATDANRPPLPYYIRGRGTMYKSGLRATSENLSKQWYTKPLGWGGAEIGNRASYAQWVHGEKQAGAMAKIGWKRLVDVAKDKTREIQAVYEKWITYTLKKLGL